MIADTKAPALATNSCSCCQLTSVIAKEDSDQSNGQVIDSGTLNGRTVYIPQMSVEGSALMASAFQAVGIDAQVYPESDDETLRLGSQFTSGDECYPQKITLGNFCKILKGKNFDPDRTAFFIAASGGPCRFGQYAPYMKKVFRDMGNLQIPIVTLDSDDGYTVSGNFQRIAWCALVCGDILRKLLLKTRPYEVNSGDTDSVHRESLQFLGEIIAIPAQSSKEKITAMQHGLEEVRDRFRKINIKPDPDRLLIGVADQYIRMATLYQFYACTSIENHK
jgi:predicted nucleotide-binding protein (sugar kinase/HSP70/actin superfamily)